MTLKTMAATPVEVLVVRVQVTTDVVLADPRGSAVSGAVSVMIPIVAATVLLAATTPPKAIVVREAAELSRPLSAPELHPPVARPDPVKPGPVIVDHLGDVKPDRGESLEMIAVALGTAQPGSRSRVFAATAVLRIAQTKIEGKAEISEMTAVRHGRIELAPVPPIASRIGIPVVTTENVEQDQVSAGMMPTVTQGQASVAVSEPHDRAFPEMTADPDFPEMTAVSDLLVRIPAARDGISAMTVAPRATAKMPLQASGTIVLAGIPMRSMFPAPAPQLRRMNRPLPRTLMQRSSPSGSRRNSKVCPRTWQASWALTSLRLAN